jgi:hypothetical protein
VLSIDTKNSDVESGHACLVRGLGTFPLPFLRFVFFFLFSLHFMLCSLYFMLCSPTLLPRCILFLYSTYSCLLVLMKL